MDSIYIIGRVLVFIALLALPQFIGLLIHFRIRNYPRSASFVGFAVTMISSFSLLQIIFYPSREEEEAEMCGLGALAALVFILFFISLQAIVSITAQIWFRYKYRS